MLWMLFFNTIPKLKWYFLKRLLQYEIWNLTNELFILCHIKIHIMVIAHWSFLSKIIKQKSSFLFYTTCFPHIGSLTPMWFHNIMYLSLWKLLVHWVMPNCQILIHFIVLQQKILFIDITADLRIKVFKQWDVVRFIVADTYFPKFKFLSSSVWLMSPGERGNNDVWI